MADSERAREFLKDGLTDAMAGVSYEHHEIHEGSHFVASFVGAPLAASTSSSVLILTGAKSLHLTGNINSDQAGRVMFYEGCTVSGNGTTLPSYNNNRLSANSSTSQFFTGPTVVTTGSEIFTEFSGGRRATGFIDRSREFVLKANEKYLFRYQSDVASNTASAVLEWYEKTI